MPENHSHLTVLDPRRRIHLDFPDLTVNRRGMREVPGVVHATAYTRECLLKGLFGESRASRIAGDGLLDQSGVFTREEIESHIRDIEGEDGFPHFEDDEMRNVFVDAVHSLSQEQHDRVFKRMELLRRGCVVEGARDPLFRHAVEKGVTSDFLITFAKRLLREPSVFVDIDPHLQRELLESISLWLQENHGREISELIWSTLQQLKVDPSSLQRIFSDTTVRSRLGVPIQALGVGPQENRFARFVPQIRKLCPFGSIPDSQKERQAIQTGEPPLKAYLLIMLQALGNHLVFELPKGLSQQISEECRRLPRNLIERFRNKLRELSRRISEIERNVRETGQPDQRVRLAALHRRRERYERISRLLFSAFGIRRGRTSPSDKEVYLRLLGFYYVTLLHRTHPNLFRIDGRVQTIHDLLQAYEVSVRLQTDQRGHPRSRRQLQVDMSADSPGRLISLLGREHAEIPQLVFFDELRTLLDLPVGDLFRVMQMSDEESAEPEEDEDEKDEREEQKEEEEEQEEQQEAEDEGEDEGAREEEEEAEEEPTAEELQNILRYRLIYAGYFLQQIALSQHLRELRAKGAEFPLKTACSINPVEGMNPPNPYFESQEWFERHGISLPQWSSSNAHELPDQRFDRIDLTVTAETTPNLLSQAYQHLQNGGILDICFPIDPPHADFLKELSRFGRVEVLRSAGEELPEQVLAFIRTQGLHESSKRFAQEFREYMKAFQPKE